MMPILALIVVSLACGLQGQSPQPAPAALLGQSSPAPSSPVTPTLSEQIPTRANYPTSTPISGDTGASSDSSEAWQTLRPGLDRRQVSLLTDKGGVRERLYMLRLDPAFFEFDVGYKPGAPQRLMDWQSETGALIVANGGYFTAENSATGLIIVNGQATGTSYAGFGGMLAISDNGPSVRSLSQQPYDPYEPLRAGLQSFPMLVMPGGQIGYPQEDGLADRRTVIAQDTHGRILFILAMTGSMTLHEMSQYLAGSDLDISVALNLDGGASSGIQLTEPPEGVAPFSLLPIVITVRPKA